MSIPLTGCVVRPAAASEARQIAALFGSSPIASGASLILGAFGQPGDVPLGGAIVNPPGQGSAHFQILVHPEFRRRKIGTRLMEAIFADARRRETRYLRLAALVHQDLPENAFYRKMGLTPERSFATYAMSLTNGVLPICAPAADRFSRRHPDATVVTLDRLEPEPVARFFSEQYGDVFEHRLQELRSGFYDLAISTAIVREGHILAASLFRSRQGNAAIFLDLVLVHPNHRRGSMPMALVAATARLAMARGLTACVFEADAEHDSFAIGCAIRGGCRPQWYRYRYSIRL